ncbi:hypothetical protein [Microvirga arabica]|uniref:hypothetical protein n=1 Tax=Microvirga arabica TaxID=1128671 RepID=UPI00193A7C0C|nr:hypothetical protein [Microvirga arabica]MBM1172835.1 hypothetical protein [Microvirga arabica]
MPGRTVPSEHLREFLKHLELYSFEDISDELRERGESVHPDTLKRIAEGEVARTHPLATLPAVFFDVQAPESLTDETIARQAFLLHELISMASRDERFGELGVLIEVARCTYTVHRPSASEITSAILDYLLAQTHIFQVRHGLAVTDDEDARLEEEAKTLKRTLKLLKQSIEGFRVHMDEDKQSFIEFFLVRAYEAHLYAADALDDRMVHDGQPSELANARASAKWLHQIGAIELLLRNAEKTKRVVVAYNAAEMSGLADDKTQCEQAFDLAFCLHPPALDGTWTFPGLSASPSAIEYLRDAFNAAMIKFIGLQ